MYVTYMWILIEKQIWHCKLSNLQHFHLKYFTRKSFLGSLQYNSKKALFSTLCKSKECLFSTIFWFCYLFPRQPHAFAKLQDIFSIIKTSLASIELFVCKDLNVTGPSFGNLQRNRFLRRPCSIGVVYQMTFHQFKSSKSKLSYLREVRNVSHYSWKHDFHVRKILIPTFPETRRRTNRLLIS